MSFADVASSASAATPPTRVRVPLAGVGARKLVGNVRHLSGSPEAVRIVRAYVADAARRAEEKQRDREWEQWVASRPRKPKARFGVRTSAPNGLRGSMDGWHERRR
jgi:hypothetical protein